MDNNYPLDVGQIKLRRGFLTAVGSQRIRLVAQKEIGVSIC